MIGNVQIVKILKTILQKNNLMFMAIHRCRRCNYLYIDKEQKICFDNLDDNFKCPRCHCSKKMFVKRKL